MSYQYRFCPSCAAQRVAYDYRCAVCGGPVRHADRSLAVATAEAPGEHRPYAIGWRALDAADAEAAARRSGRS